MRRRWWGIAALLLALALLPPPGRAQQSTAAPRDLTFILVNNIFGTPAFVAVEDGLWAKRGLNVQLKQVSSGRAVTEALRAGEAQLGHASLSTTTASARASGNLLKGVMPYYNAADYVAIAGGRAVIGRKDRGIVADDLKSLVGKKVANLAGSTNDVYLRQLLAKGGVDVGKLQLVNVPVEDMPVTLVQGQVDVAAPWEPYSAQIVRELGPNAVVVSRGAAGLVSDVVGVVANEKYIGEHLDLLEPFALGLAEAAKVVRTDPRHAAEVDTYYLDGLNVEDAVDGIRHSHWDTRHSVCTDAGILATGNGMVRDGLIKMPRPFAVEDFRDLRVLDKITAEHPELFDDLPPLPKTVAECKGQLG